MLNNRKPRVGQIRQVNPAKGEEPAMYVITGSSYDNIELKYITGKHKGEWTRWAIDFINEDWVIM